MAVILPLEELGTPPKTVGDELWLSLMDSAAMLFLQDKKILFIAQQKDLLEETRYPHFATITSSPLILGSQCQMEWLKFRKALVLALHAFSS